MAKAGFRDAFDMDCLPEPESLSQEELNETWMDLTMATSLDRAVARQTLADDEEVLHDGGCPFCGSTGYYRNIGKDHWFYCETHKTKWYVGSNLYSNWQYQSEKIWLENARVLESYTEVEPVSSWRGRTRPRPLSPFLASSWLKGRKRYCTRNE
jgi:hypothetical protein